MARCDMLKDVILLTSGSYITPSKRMEKSNLHQISYHIKAQELACVYETEKPTVACRPFGSLVILNSMPSKLDSRDEHLSFKTRRVMHE